VIALLTASLYCAFHLTEVWRERQGEVQLHAKGQTVWATVMAMGKAPPEDRFHFGYSHTHSHTLDLRYDIAGTSRSCTRAVHADTGYRTQVGSKVEIQYLREDPADCRVRAEKSVTLDDLDNEVFVSGLMLILTMLGLTAAFVPYFSKRKQPQGRFTHTSITCPECAQTMERGVLVNATAIIPETSGALRNYMPALERRGVPWELNR
jgi:hypothetical protein